MKTLSKVILEIKRKNPDMIVTLKTERYGMFWSGKVKFASSALTFDSAQEKVKSITNRQYDIAIVI